MGELFGYARVSTTDQDLNVQLKALNDYADREKREILIFSEKKSGTSTEGRLELARLLAHVRSGDMIAVTRVDRIARSVNDLSTIVDKLTKRGIVLKATEQNIDTTTKEGNAFLQMLGVFAEFETALRKDRQMEGIAVAKEKGVYKGRAVSIDTNKINELAAAGKGATAIAKQLGIGRASVYRHLWSLEKVK
jgi:DNA invertase Pin-like site-specific DNA recombinase